MVKYYRQLIVLSFFCLFLWPIQIKAQMVEQGIHFGLKIPYTYDFGYYKRFSSRFGMHLDVQMITIPFSNMPMTYMEMWGADPKLTNILDMPFTLGVGVDLGPHYYFGSDNRRYYVGISFQWMNLLKRDIEDEVINEAFGVDLDGPDFPEGPISKDDSTKPLTITTNYIQLGFFAGKKWQLRSPEWEIRAEAGLSMNVWSNHVLASDYRYLTPIADRCNNELKSMMKKYGWYPTLNVFLIYKLDYKN